MFDGILSQITPKAWLRTTLQALRRLISSWISYSLNFAWQNSNRIAKKQSPYASRQPTLLLAWPELPSSRVKLLANPIWWASLLIGLLGRLESQPTKFGRGYSAANLMLTPLCLVEILEASTLSLLAKASIWLIAPLVESCSRPKP